MGRIDSGDIEMTKKEDKSYKFCLFTGKGDEQITVYSEKEKAAEIKKGRTVIHPDLIKKSDKK